MTSFVSRYIFAVLLCLSIVLPQTSAALAGLGLADGRVVVICTGDGLRTIRIDDSGEPVEISQDAELCALVHAADTSATSHADEIAALWLYSLVPVVAASLLAPADIYSASLPRGPPADLALLNQS